jgi:hypothetical protein
VIYESRDERLKKQLTLINRNFNLLGDVQTLCERAEVNVVQGILEGKYDWDEEKKQEDAIV